MAWTRMIFDESAKTCEPAVWLYLWGIELEYWARCNTGDNIWTLAMEAIEEVNRLKLERVK